LPTISEVTLLLRNWGKLNEFYSAQSAYQRFFVGSTSFEPCKLTVWMSWAPLRCKFFLWLDRCWTADKLARQGLPYQPCCPLCDHKEEDIEHPRFNLRLLPPSLVRCPRQVRPASNIRHLAPGPHDDSFQRWWHEATRRAPKMVRKDVNSLMILQAWTLWKHRNRCVFVGVTPSVSESQ
jgi:hypothetical protein